MKKLYAALAVLTLCSSAYAGTAAAPTKQQSKMTTCNADAAGKKGDERKAFMKTCLSAAPAAAPAKTMTPQQEKMKACSAEGKGKKGAEYKAFMKTCLSAPKA